MTTMFKKDPGDITDFSLDWSIILDPGETIVTSIWLFYDANRVITTDLVEEAKTNTGTLATVVVSGGTSNTKYILVNQITTTGSRTLERSVYLGINYLFV